MQLDVGPFCFALPQSGPAHRRTGQATQSVPAEAAISRLDRQQMRQIV